VHGRVGEFAVVEKDVPRVRAQQAHDHVETGGLAGAVGAEQAIAYLLRIPCPVAARFDPADLLVDEADREQVCLQAHGALLQFHLAPVDHGSGSFVEFRGVGPNVDGFIGVLWLYAGQHGRQAVSWQRKQRDQAN
jgi:hypothetical protein